MIVKYHYPPSNRPQDFTTGEGWDFTENRFWGLDGQPIETGCGYDGNKGGDGGLGGGDFDGGTLG